MNRYVIAFYMILYLLMWISPNSTLNAADLFPYKVRTKDYSGLGAGIRGDINRVGMAGATVAVPFNISAVQSNPAGLAMGVASVSAQIVKSPSPITKFKKVKLNLKVISGDYQSVRPRGALEFYIIHPPVKVGIIVHPTQAMMCLAKYR